MSSSQGKWGSSVLLWNEEMKNHGRNSDFKPTEHSSYELIEGMMGIEVVTDDFIAVGCGDVWTEHSSYYDVTAM